MTSQEPDPFDDLLARLEPDLASRDARYKTLRLKMYRFFEWRRCETSWELADETIVRLVKNVRGGEHVRAYSYIYQIARYVLNEQIRSEKKQKEIVSSLPPRVHERDPSLDCKRECLDRLKHDKRKLLERYYSSQESGEELAKAFGTTVPKLRLQIHRLKKKLKECYQSCEDDSVSGGN